jgi:hypothetical protein
VNKKMKRQLDAIWATLEGTGWKRDDIVPAATKMVDTYVGQKTATIWIGQQLDQVNNFSVSAEYWSEGRNIASADGLILNLEDTLEEVRASVKRFLGQVECRIAESYAVRLMRAA